MTNGFKRLVTDAARLGFPARDGLRTAVALTRITGDDQGHDPANGQFTKYDRKKHGPITVTPYSSANGTMHKAVSRGHGKFEWGHTPEHAANALAAAIEGKK